MDKPYTERTGGSYVRDKNGKRKLVETTETEAPAETIVTPVAEPKKDK